MPEAFAISSDDRYPIIRLMPRCGACLSQTRLDLPNGGQPFRGNHVRRFEFCKPMVH